MNKWQCEIMVCQHYFPRDKPKLSICISWPFDHFPPLIETQMNRIINVFIIRFFYFAPAAAQSILLIYKSRIRNPSNIIIMQARRSINTNQELLSDVVWSHGRWPHAHAHITLLHTQLQLVITKWRCKNVLNYQNSDFSGSQ